MFLGDFGAEVIKIDPPGAAFPLPVEMEEERWAAYYAHDRNKRSIILNLKTEEGRQVFYRLAKNADVLVEGFRPGVMKRFNADYETLKQINPRLVYCSLTGYGQDGPYRDLPGHDMNYSAMAGALSLIGERGGRPHLASNLLADQAGAGLHATIGILIALLARERTGKGQFVDIAFTDGVISLLTFEASLHFYTGVVPRRGETFTTGAAPWGNVYQTKDGKWIMMMHLQPDVYWSMFCKALELEHIENDERFSSFLPRLQHEGELVPIVEESMAKRTLDEWKQRMDECGLIWAPVQEPTDVAKDPQAWATDCFETVEHPTLGPISFVAIPMKLSRSPASIRTTAPELGQHTEEALLEIGYSWDDIARLKEDGIVA